MPDWILLAGQWDTAAGIARTLKEVCTLGTPVCICPHTCIEVDRQEWTPKESGLAEWRTLATILARSSSTIWDTRTFSMPSGTLGYQ